ncbi:sigma-70 family RNA polymerase sigma factor [Marinibactrum halimedae]|uniref:RNA polymerase sigma factor n=1 Tax=Marinibactrum halimedae TaxID=1444977 RepID=A0AA37T8L3_9GAMM|nr:sigma-70 family RNA polymerase sigma factor [Marinibactrum halimedae]MCD9457556.1 sigma-70 family RNA polymerase sigma factor [Marinibactrum halimedae]GLS25390.1 RNA polymerase sigma factor [Marinibactrum halimedae]
MAEYALATSPGQATRGNKPMQTNVLRDDDWSRVLVSIAQKDRIAFQRFFEHFAPLVKGYCLSKPVPGQPPTLADELVQEVMIKVWLKAQSFDPHKASASTWLFTLARNCRIDLLRRNNKHISQPLESDDLWATEDEQTPVTHLQQSRDSGVLKASMKTLPPEQKEILKKVFMEGKTHSEAAEELKLPLGTVKSRTRLGLKKLKVLIGRNVNEVGQ